MTERRSWPHDLDGLQEMALEEILPEWRADVDRPDRSWPTIEWLNEHRYSHLRWILREKHGMSVKTFFGMIVGCEDPDDYWNINDLKTIQEAERFLAAKDIDRGWTGETLPTIKSLLNRVFDEYASLTDNESIIDIANDLSRKTEAYEAFEEVIRQIRSEAKSDNSAYKYLRAIQRLFNYLERRHKIEHNPTKGLEKEFDFDLDAEGSTPLSPQQVSQLWETAETLVEYMLIIGYVIWGVRTKELPSIHKSQFLFEEDEIKIHFEETDRKNGEGTVTILFGVDYILELLHRHAVKSGWNGHLLVSPKDTGKPMNKETAKNRFMELCDRAGVTIDGETPTPSNGRATWMDLQSRAGAMHIEIMMERIKLQGNEDPESAVDYTDEETQEQMRQLLFLQELKSILPEEAYETNFVFLRDLKQQLDLG